MSAPDYGDLQQQFSGSFGSLNRLSRGPADVPMGPPPNRSSFPPGSQEWGGAERPSDQNWNGPPLEAGGNWGAGGRDGPMMPPGNIISGAGRGPMFGDGRGRGGFGRGPGPEFPQRGGGFGHFGRGHWGNEGDFIGGRGRGFGEAQGMGGYGGRGGFRGRGDIRGRGVPGRWGARHGWEGRGRRDGPRQPDVDPALLERRRASTAALLKRQVAQLPVSRDLLGEDEAADAYTRIMESAANVAGPQPSVRSLYTYPMFSVEESSGVPSSMSAATDNSQAFEQCLQLYQEAHQTLHNPAVQQGHMPPLQVGFSSGVTTAHIRAKMRT